MPELQNTQILRIINVMEMIPILSDLTNEQFESLLSICTKQDIPGYTILFKEGEPSNEMYILTEGTLKVTLRGGEIGRILPINTVGEMGVLTGEVRSATIVTISNCTTLRIMKKDLCDLFEKDKDFYIKFQRSMLVDLSNKLREANETIAKLIAKLDKLV